MWRNCSRSIPSRSGAKTGSTWVTSRNNHFTTGSTGTIVDVDMNALARENQMSATELAVVIESRMESPEPQTTIVNYLKTRESKPLTVRDEKELKKLTGDEELYISKQYGMTSIKWGGGNKGGCLFIAHSEKNVTIDTAKILEKNVCYFGA